MRRHEILGLAIATVLLTILFGCKIGGPDGDTLSPALVLKVGTETITSGSTYDFGGVRVNSSSEEVVFSLTNEGDGAFELPTAEAFDISGSASSQFVLVTGSIPRTIEPGRSVYFTITFTPSSIGLKTATVQVPHEDPDVEYIFSVTGRGTDAPAGASGVTVAYAEGHAVEVSWTDNSENEDGFRVERRSGAGSYQTVQETSANTDTWLDAGVLLDTGYTYRVIAFNAEGSGPASNEAAIITPPLPPSGIVATATATNQVYLTWDDNAATETQYLLERRQGAGDWSLVHSLPAGTQSCYDGGLVTATAYTYRVRAYNEHYYSDYDTSAEVTTLPVWTIETVDSSGTVGQWTSIALAADIPHVSYYSVTGGDLKHARRVSGSWIVTTVDSSSAGQYSAIDINTMGYPCISYYSENYTPRRLAFAEYDGSTWQRNYTAHTDSSADTGMHTDIVVDSSNNVHISYWTEQHSSSGTSGAYVKRTGSVWDTPYQFVQEWWWNPLEGYWTSIGLNTSGYPHVVYYGGRQYYDDGWHYPNELSHAYYNGSTWTVEVVETYPSSSVADLVGIGKYLSLVMDGNTPRISYYDEVTGNGNLKYAYKSGTWTKVGVDTGSENRGMWTSIGVGPTGHVHISYYDASAQDLRYAYYNGSSWSHAAVDTAGNVGQYTSIAVDSSGMPHISYYDATNGDLKYARKNRTVP